MNGSTFKMRLYSVILAVVVMVEYYFKNKFKCEIKNKIKKKKGKNPCNKINAPLQ